MPAVTPLPLTYLELAQAIVDNTRIRDSVRPISFAVCALEITQAASC